MQYREASKEEHEVVCKQVRRNAVLNVCLLAPVTPITLLGVFLSINMMKRNSRKYDNVTFTVTTVILVLFILAVAFFILKLMNEFVKRIRYINKHQYAVADCTVTGKERIPNPKHVHFYVTVAASDGSSLKVWVTSKVFYLAENGKRALVVMYKEPAEKKKKLPLEAVVLD